MCSVQECIKEIGLEERLSITVRPGRGVPLAPTESLATLTSSPGAGASQAASGKGQGHFAGSVL